VGEVTRRGTLVLAAVLLLAACSRASVDRAEWQRMDRDARELYVQSLVGAEQAKEAKGGGGNRYTRPAAEYVARIDEAYARGDGREPHLIFTELRD
jgi:hypothetical protein